jgi:hypothetical protein
VSFPLDVVRSLLSKLVTHLGVLAKYHDVTEARAAITYDGGHLLFRAGGQVGRMRVPETVEVLAEVVMKMLATAAVNVPDREAEDDVEMVSG